MVEFADSPPELPPAMVIRDPWIRALVVVMLLIASVYLTGMVWQVATQFADVILLFFLAWMISFILEPFVARLYARRGVSRPLAVATVYLTVLITALYAVIQIVPRLSAQLIQLSLELPAYVEWTNGQTLSDQAALARQGVSIAPESLLTYQEVTRHV